jgi:hypothetical protein
MRVSNTNSEVRGTMDVAGDAIHVVELPGGYLLSKGDKQRSVMNKLYKGRESEVKTELLSRKQQQERQCPPLDRCNTGGRVVISMAVWKGSKNKSCLHGVNIGPDLRLLYHQLVRLFPAKAMCTTRHQ